MRSCHSWGRASQAGSATRTISMPCSQVFLDGMRCAACWRDSNRKKKCSCSAGASQCLCPSSHADMMKHSGRVCSEATAEGVKKKISRSWDIDLAGSGGLARKCSPLFLNRQERKVFFTQIMQIVWMKTDL